LTGANGYRPWRVLHVDLAEGVPELRADPQIGGVHAVVWWRGIPLGQLDILAGQLPVSREHLTAAALQRIAPAVGDRLLSRGFTARRPPQVAAREVADFAELLALERPLQQLERKLGERWRSLDPSTRVSVVVCTRERPHELARCQAAIRAQSLPPHEVVVVDNAPESDATRELAARMPDVRYVREPRRGQAVARNTGIRETSGELVAFTDDDVVVHPEWLRRLVPAFDEPDVMCATGLVLPAELETEPQWFFEHVFGGFGQGYRAIRFDRTFFEAGLSHGVPVWGIGAGANMAFRRELFEAAGLFDERLGPGAAGCSDDSEMWYRVLAAGFACRYEPAAVVHHHHRRDPAALEHQMHQYMRGHAAALLVQHERHGDRGNLRRLLMTLPRTYARRIADRFIFGAMPDHRTLWAEVRGCLSGAWFYLRAPRPRGVRAARARHKAPLRPFLARNPFEDPLTLGFFYREKMRAVHRVAPDETYEHVLEVGGGRGGLTALLYPRARVTNVDADASYADSPVNRRPNVRFVHGDATALPFPDESFDAVTLFDVLEHIPDDSAAVAEALRVLRPGGALLVSNPSERWRFPYHAALRRVCRTEEQMLEEWGHVRRGYSLEQLGELTGLACERRATFINPVTVLAHDLSFSRLPRRVRRAAVGALAPLLWPAYARHRAGTRGTEVASLWRKPRRAGAP
jgi:GT2 family glycosyltransferase/ubiquinone/menaquinone biosynthesis C-methylase UbiE